MSSQLKDEMGLQDLELCDASRSQNHAWREGGEGVNTGGRDGEQESWTVMVRKKGQKGVRGQPER